MLSAHFVLGGNKKAVFDDFYRKLFIVRHSVLHPYLLALYQRIMHNIVTVKVFLVHIYRSYLMVVVGCVVINSLVGVTAGGIKRDFVLSLVHLTAPELLVDRAQYMKELAYALVLAVARNRVHFRKCCPYKA